MSDELTSFVTAIRELAKVRKTLKRVIEVCAVYDRDGQDVPTSEIRVALNQEEI